MKGAFVTGAAGFIGGYAVREFVEQGWHVFALAHRSVSDNLKTLAGRGRVTIIRGDATDGDGVRSALVRETRSLGIPAEAIVHCAGRASDVGWRREFRRTNFDSVKNMVEMTRDLAVGRLVFVSTTDVYGLRDFNGESEDALPLAAHPRNAYPEYKIRAEAWIRENLPKDRFCIIRPAQVWGVGDRTLTPRIVNFLRSSPWIVHFGRWQGRNRWPLAHVRNVAAATFIGATLPEAAGLAVNVADSERTTMDEFYRLLAEVYLPGKRFRTVTLPFWTGWLAGAVISAVSNVLNLAKPFADPSLYALYSVSRNLDFGNARLLDLLRTAGRHLVTREEGLVELLTRS